ncbi:hypothetical protein [Plebeiibacterium marinum]|uniref:Uncharacterized protein n=1 Tax=Plebeiibacterium marinum TaxID=2992111 RepID=A0AAE3MGC2_9BACT|nr:hypothetical protein [Plebeiobacterium marinum]MCW3806971.1 hypothetical protein [Plebeiobacterium marinum]
MQKTKINGLILICCSLLTFNTAIVQAQTNNVIEDFKPSEVNQPGKQSPMVNSQGCVRVQVAAPETKMVQLDIGGVKYYLKKEQQWSLDRGVCPSGRRVSLLSVKY